MNNSPETSKYWHFRCNDTSTKQYEHLQQVECDYMKIGEIEQNKVREGSHFHAIVIFSRSQRFSYVKKHLLLNQKLRQADWHLSAKYTNNTVDSFVNYAIKEGTRFTKGNYQSIGKGAVSNIIEIEQQAEDQQNLLDVKTNKESEIERKRLLNLARIDHARKLDYNWFLMNDMHYFNSGQCKTLFANVQHKKLENLTEMDNYYIYGEPGTGKSSAITFLYPGHYPKLKTNEKWDSYSNYLPEHETVYFDELDTVDMYDRCMGGLEEFKTMTDVYPFAVRSNYGSAQVMIRPKRFIITSNFTPSQVFSTMNKFGKKLQNVEMILKAFNRRFKVMHISEFQDLKSIYFDKKEKRTKWKFIDEKELPSTSEMTFGYIETRHEIQQMKIQEAMDEHAYKTLEHVMMPKKITKKRKPHKPKKKITIN